MALKENERKKTLSVREYLGVLFTHGSLHKPFVLHRPSLSEQLREVERLRKHLADCPCPSCGEKKLLLVSYIQGQTQWGAKVFCASCTTSGELNAKGFNIELASLKENAGEQGKDKKINPKKETKKQ